MLTTLHAGELEAPFILTKGAISYIEIDGLPLDQYPPGHSVKYALTTEILYGLGRRKQFSAIAQLYKLVIPGLILSAHLFQGLNRYLYCNNANSATNGDEDKFVFSRKPKQDFFWQGGRDGREVATHAPLNQVFVVVVTNNIKHRDEFPGVEGWIEHWSWVEEDSVLKGAPIDWVDRYKKKVWSRTD
jgi:hypothetical protein